MNELHLREWIENKMEKILIHSPFNNPCWREPPTTTNVNVVGMCFTAVYTHPPPPPMFTSLLIVNILPVEDQWVGWL